MYILSRLPHHISLPALARFILLLPYLCLLCFPEALAEPLSVNPLKGADSETCGMTLQVPCKTIQYALHNRKATALSLSPSVFNESSVLISDIPKLIINGTIGTVFDCSLRTNLSGLSDPAFIFSNATVVISHLTFQNCTNLRVADGVGGALSATSSNLNISDCFFFNNVAQIGGAIGAIFSKLVVSSSVFQSNTATCPNSTSMSQVCSAWGGAIGTIEAQEIAVIGCSFVSNMVNLVFVGVTNPNSASAGGGGCISVMHKGNVSESHIDIDGNTFAGCLVKMFGLNSSLTAGIQYGNTYGGAVSVYYGRSALFAVNVVNVATSFSNNRCFNSGIVSSVGVSGNAYGGCLSVYAGAWNVNMQSHASLSSVYVSRMQMIISSNNIVNCSAVMKSSSWSSSGNVYGGAISVYLGHCVVGRSSSTVSGNTIVTDSVYLLKSNALFGCNSSSITSGAQNEGIGSFGANVYGGGVSLVVGSYSLSFDNSEGETDSSNSTVLGSTAVTNTSYIITDNTFIDCAVVSSVSGLEKSGGDKSHGANVYGGGVSLTVGAYSYSFSSGQRSSRSVVSGSTQVIDSNYHLSRNVFTRCQVLSIAQSLEVRGGLSVGANAHGGGMSLVVGAYSYSYSLRMSSSSVFGTIVSGSSYVITDNRLTSCNASSLTLKNETFYIDGILGIGFGGSFGTNAHGGGISLIVGAYSHSFGVLSSSDSLIYGESSVSDVKLSIAGNSLINCIASSKTTGGGGSFGGNSYGGGLSFMVGGYSFGLSKKSRSSSNVSGVTVVGHTKYTMVNNTFTDCNATSTTGRSVTEGFGSYGVSVYGGGLSFNVGAYSFSSSLCSSSTSDEGRCSSYVVSSNVSGDTVFNNVSSVVTRNVFTSCSVETETSRNLLPGAQNSLNDGSFGANAYGGAISFVIGPYCYASSNTFSSSSVYGSVIHNDSKLFVNNNVFVNCEAMSISSGGGGSNAANSYGGGVSLLVGAYSYSYTFPTIQKSQSISIVSGITAVHSTSFSITHNALINCVASSYTTRNSISGFGSYGANVYGGGISIVAGAYSYSFGINEGSGCRSEVSGDTALSTMTYMFSSNILSNCNASSINSGGASSDGANSHGGGLSFIVGAYSYSYNQGGVSSDSVVSGITMVSVGNFTFANNTLYDCKALSETSGFSVGSDGYGGGIALMVGAYCYRFGNVGGSGGSTVSGRTAAINVSYYMTKNLFENCSVVSRNDQNSLRASCFGGAVSLIYRPQIRPETNESITTAVVESSSALASNSTFIRCIASTTSESCASSSSNAAGGALYFRMPSGLINITTSFFSSSSASVLCSAFSSSSFGSGGGVAVFRANHVYVSFSVFEGCFARGVPQGNNVMVSGGGLHVGDSEALFFQNCVIRKSSIRDAFSTFLQSGGGALSTLNLSTVYISRSVFLNNGDSSESGIVFLLQLKNQSMVVTTAHSYISTAPSKISALHVSCGKVCPEEQQRKIVVLFENSNVVVIQSDKSDASRESSSLMSMPAFSSVHSENSSLNCNFTGTSELAVLKLNSESVSSISITCAPCQKSFEVTSTSEDLDLAKLSQFLNVRQQCESLASSSSQQCPYGVAYCTTTLLITVGFWTNFSADGKLKNPSICPPKYCGCQNIAGYSNPACRLFPPLSPKFFADDALCNHNRSGVLCGGCKSNFSQSLNGYSCVLNDDCLRNMGLTWALSVMGFIFYSGYIVISSSTANNGLIMCVLLYGQMSSFASIPSVVADNTQRSISSSWLSEVSQFTSIASLYSNSCYGPDMGAYAATLFRLSGPAIVFVSSILITVVFKHLFKRHIDLSHKLKVNVSYTATITNALLLLFSSVTDVVFLLITCQNIGDDNKVVFIDGTVQCDGPGYAGLVFIATILCLVPILFWAGLKFNKIPAKARAVACSPFSEARHYWVAASLLFRFSMTIISATYRQLPSVQSMVLAILSISMLMLLIALRPYIYYRTFFMDIFCYTCLSVQFLLASLVRASESLGMSAGPANNFFSTMNNAAEASIILRFLPFVICAFFILLDFSATQFSKFGFQTGRIRLLASLSVEIQGTSSETLNGALL